MVANSTYTLSGYIEYISSSVGFVTPVFKDDEGRYCIQVITGHLQSCHWQLLPETYIRDVITFPFSKDIDSFESFVYGFKRNESVFFAVAKDMVKHLSGLLSSGITEGKALAEGFIKDWILLEPITENLTKEQIWNDCLRIVGKESTTMPRIFEENFEVVEYDNKTLVLKAENNSVKRVFEEKFIEQLISHFQKGISNFNIRVVDTTSVLKSSPLVFWGGGKAIYTQGSFIMETKIQPFQDFDNFIVSDFNENAYSRSHDFIQRQPGGILTIQGAAGVGKTHLVNSIAKYFSVHDVDKNVGLYTVFSQQENKKITQNDIDKFEAMASGNDVIIIDDAHHMYDEKPLFQNLIRIIQKWRGMEKSIILSFRDSYHVDIGPELLKETEQIVLPNPGKDDKLKIVESKVSAYNIQLSGRDSLTISEVVQLQNLTDIERYLTRAYLIEDIYWPRYRFYLSYLRAYDLNLKSLQSLTLDYFKLNLDDTKSATTEMVSLNAKLISYFIQDIFLTPDHTSSDKIGSYNIDGVYYSFDTMRHFLFESKPFKKTIVEILKEVISKDDKG